MEGRAGVKRTLAARSAHAARAGSVDHENNVRLVEKLVVRMGDARLVAYRIERAPHRLGYGWVREEIVDERKGGITVGLVFEIRFGDDYDRR